MKNMEEFSKNATSAPDVYFGVILLFHENDLWRPIEPRDNMIREMAFA